MKREFLKLLRSEGLLMAWMGGTPQLPHKRSVQSDSRLDTLRDQS